MGILHTLVKDIQLPKMIEIRQRFEKNTIDDIEKEVISQLDNQKIYSRILPQMTVAITAGSRGVQNIALITKTVCDYIKKHKGLPFIVPSMGSHGGANADGQVEILKDYGITEKYCGCQIKPSMDTVPIANAEDGRKIYLSKEAFNADGIIVIGRVKPHTAFRGEIESGIAKMIAVGMGKQKGAESIHLNGFGVMEESIVEYSSAIIDRCNIVTTIALVENAYDQTVSINIIPPENIFKEEPKLLKEAKRLMAQILIPKGNVLIVDKIGKNYSGDGQDPNITGNFITPYASGGFTKDRTVFLDLSDETHGNAVGVGMADVITRRLYNKIDHEKGYANAVTSMTIEGYKVPVTAENDKEAIQVAVKNCPRIIYQEAKIVRIANTLELGDIYISESLVEDAKKCENIEIIGEMENFKFDSYGNLF